MTLPPNPRTRQQILVVEDDSAVVRALVFMAGTRGFDVRGCKTAAEALLVADRGFACLIIDQNLPDFRGVDLLETLRRRGVVTPAVIIATAPSLVLRRQASALATPIVEKPLLDEALFIEVNRLLGRV